MRANPPLKIKKKGGTVQMEKKEITDEYVLSKEKLTSHEAADYLGISWWNLSDGLKNGTYTFGTATTGRGGRTVFTIYAKQVYDFKHGTCDINKQQYIEKIYEFLSNLGYRISTEEQKLMDGTHEIFEKE